MRCSGRQCLSDVIGSARVYGRSRELGEIIINAYGRIMMKYTQ